MNAYSGFLIMAEAIKAANSVEPDKVQAAAAKLDRPERSYPTGFGVKFDKNFQNQRALFTVSQWQGGKLVTVFPKAAVPPGVQLRPLGRK
jgi:branched-chain amino acid transport system substrate-binding protein